MRVDDGPGSDGATAVGAGDSGSSFCLSFNGKRLLQDLNEMAERFVTLDFLSDPFLSADLSTGILSVLLCDNFLNCCGSHFFLE